MTRRSTIEDRASMTAGVCVEPGVFELRRVPAPSQAAEGWAIIDIASIGLCGTDYHIFQGKHPYLQYPRIIGHELSGRLVEAVGGMAAGDLVVVNPYISCGDCRACRKGKENCCSQIQVLGVHRDGGLCSRLAVPLANLYPADGLSEVQASMVEFLAIGAQAVARSGTKIGDRVLVTGAGPIGIGAALFARLEGAEVHMLDLSARRLAIANQRFAFEHLHTTGASALETTSGDGFDVIFDATGSAAAIEAGFPLLAHGSAHVLISVVKGDITFNDAEFHKRETQTIGSRNALRADFERVVAALRSGQINAADLLSEEIDLADLPQRFAELANDRESLIKAVVRP